jgi:hypothetical protein
VENLATGIKRLKQSPNKTKVLVLVLLSKQVCPDSIYTVLLDFISA